MFFIVLYHLPTSKSLNSLNNIKSEIRFDFPVIILPQLIIILFMLVFFHWFLAISNLEKLKKLDKHEIWCQIWTPRHRFTLVRTLRRNMRRISFKKNVFLTLPVILPVKPVSRYFETHTRPQFGPWAKYLQKVSYFYLLCVPRFCARNFFVLQAP